jgi:hypothetical protein
VETFRSVIICEITVHWLVIIRNNLINVIYFNENSHIFQIIPEPGDAFAQSRHFQKHEQAVEVTVDGRSLEQEPGYSRNISLKPTADITIGQYNNGT